VESETEGGVLRPFHEAALRLSRASEAAQADAARESAEAFLALQEQVRELDQAHFAAAMELNRRALQSLSAAVGEAESPEAVFTAQVKAQLDIESEFRRVHEDTDAKLAALAESVAQESNQAIVDRCVAKREEAYAAYVAEVQQAWAGVKDPDPETMGAISQHILSTLLTVRV
jgi:hypothetical protein